MFNVLWTGGNGAHNGTNLPPSSTIKEANEHMQAMVRRIVDLEQRVNEQTELMNRRELENTVRHQNVDRQKGLEMAGLQQDMSKLKDRCRQLEGQLKEKDVHIAYLFHRCSYLDEAASYVPLLDQLSQCLKSSLAAPPPKVISVKSNRPTSNNNGQQQQQLEYTPDVPIAPSDKHQHQHHPYGAPSNTAASPSSAALAEHFARPQQQQQQTQQKQQQHQTKLPTAQPYIPNYPEPNGSIFAASPSVVAANGHHKK